MAYIVSMARVLTHELTKFASQRRHQLVGHVANLDFWLAEVRHCLRVLDEYSPRYERTFAAQTKYIFEHKVVEFDLDEPTPMRGPAIPSKRLPDEERQEARRLLGEAAYGFLVRCCNKGFIDESVLRRECARLGLEVVADDLKVQKS